MSSLIIQIFGNSQIYELKSNKLLQLLKKACIIGGEKLPDKLLDLKNDLVFQELFGNPKNDKITGHLLSLILKKEIQILI